MLQNPSLILLHSLWTHTKHGVIFSGLSGVPAIATERKIAIGARIEVFILGILVRQDESMEVLMWSV